MTREPFRYAGLAAIATLWLTLGAAALLSDFPLLGERPLSWLVDEPAPGLLFRAGLIVGSLNLAAFHVHVRRRYRVTKGFSAALLAGQFGQLVAAVVPIDQGPTAHGIHTVAAIGVGASLPVLMWRFAAAQPPGGGRRVAYGLFWAEVAACGVGLALSSLSVAPLAEILPAAGFHVWIVALTMSGVLAPRPGAAATMDRGLRARVELTPAEPAGMGRTLPLQGLSLQPRRWARRRDTSSEQRSSTAS
ncbi:hypothetical protein BH18ACT4_BH18ACT4_12510 [soil metagenome]